MLKPELKKECDLSPTDFACQAVWLNVHAHDSNEPWYEECDEETFRPWTGSLPFVETKGFVLVADGPVASLQGLHADRVF
jgi:hypothetical protein